MSELQSFGQQTFDLVVGVGIIRKTGKRVIVFVRDRKNNVLHGLGQDFIEERGPKRYAISGSVPDRIVVTMTARDGKFRRWIAVEIRTDRIDHKLSFRPYPRMGIVQTDTVIGVIILFGELFGIADVRTPPHGRTQHIIEPPDMIELRAFTIIRIVVLRNIHEILAFYPEIIESIERLSEIAVNNEASALASQETFVGKKNIVVIIGWREIKIPAFISPAKLVLKGTEI